MKTALALLVLFATACGSSSKPSDAGGTGGVPGTGGATGGSGGGTGGTGGASGGSGGSVSDGGGGSGDGPVGRDGGPDAAPIADAGPDGGPPDSGAPPSDGGSTQSLDQCFADLRPLMRTYQLATKASADGKTRVRIALEVPAGTFSTPGTVGWAFLRFGVEHDGVTSCATQPAQLHYKGTLHNCKDTASIDADGRTFDVVAPDRDTAQVSSSMAGTVVWGPVTVTNTTCTGARNSTPGACISGGPCL